MTDTAIEWPKKKRELRNQVCDSTRWNGFKFRDDDIVVASYAKAGTTLTQQMVTQLVWGAPGGVTSGPDKSPWLDMSPIPLPVILGMLEAQQQRRVIKTHLPLNTLVFSPQAKYIYVARDVRDVVWAAHNHANGFTPAALAQFASVETDKSMPDIPLDIHTFYHQFIDQGGEGESTFGSFWEHVQSWFDARHLPNVLVLHYNNLKANLPREIRRTAGFLNISIDEALVAKVAEHCDINYMRNAVKANAFADGMLKRSFKNGADTFFNKGTNGRWKDVLTAEEIAKADKAAARNLTPECAHWLKTGELPDRKN